MGLLYQFPNQLNELDDRVGVRDDQSLVLKTYGLPWLFWGYYAAILVVLFFMFLAIRSPLETILSGDDQINRFLAYLAISVMLFIPFSGLCMLFYEKVLTKKDRILTVTHRVFWIPVWSTKYFLSQKEAVTLRHFMDSPNVARIEHKKGHEAFENRGHYEVIVVCEKKGEVIIDRHSQKHEVKKFIELINQY